MIQGYHLTNGEFQPCDITRGFEILPQKGIALCRTPFIDPSADWDAFLKACKILKTQIPYAPYVYIDATWDPVRISDYTLINKRISVGDIFPDSKICVLSAKAQHWFSDIPGVVYFPQFLMSNYDEPNPLIDIRQGRFGCLNRRTAAHRSWLMHNLLKHKLIDSTMDIYSINFTSLSTNSYWDLTDWINNGQAINEEIRAWHPQIATHPDNFPNDYSVNHLAWRTGISIITETEPGDLTLISEKTGKGFVSKSCFTVYMADVGYQVLEELGFEPRFFKKHAEYTDVEPILKMFHKISNEADAIEYRHQRLSQIEHNYRWFDYRGFDSIPDMKFDEKPWFSKYRPKLQQALERL